MAVIGCGGQSRLAAAGGPGCPRESAATCAARASPSSSSARGSRRGRGCRGRGSHGREERIAARAVIDASGTWSTPGPLAGDREAAERVEPTLPETGDRRPETAAAPACSTTPTPPGAATPAAADTVPAPIASRTPFTRPAPGLRRPPPISLVAC
ncbi:hypothetical protein SipoB123_20680 [Streptomyces ipomoeae]|nr:hypothetical protein SipoB123_20680 [Streptomyces ipomoeae]